MQTKNSIKYKELDNGFKKNNLFENILSFVNYLKVVSG